MSFGQYNLTQEIIGVAALSIPSLSRLQTHQRSKRGGVSAPPRQQHYWVLYTTAALRTLPTTVRARVHPVRTRAILNKENIGAHLALNHAYPLLLSLLPYLPTKAHHYANLIL